MANLTPSLNLKAPPFEVGSSSTIAAAAAAAANMDRRMQSAEHLVLDLCNPDLRENALLELSKKRELFQDLAPLLWNSFGTVAALLQEIVSIYPVLSPPNLTPAQSNRVCNALALLQRKKAHAMAHDVLGSSLVPRMALGFAMAVERPSAEGAKKH
ncbi:UNVERIFIED_CONTAM: CCR4-NOT transcription complex subunit [Sesamum calycinum]|uniref:CCR4-NOT transcription complex subunit n=1 Tax=Sesamum calycinum TaxID=2727403 RepID=A0AAW2Q3T1_9LAMI